MLSTTSYYKTAIKQPSRNIKPKVEIYFDGDALPPVALGSDNIAGIDLLEETQAEGQTPLGAVSSNEVVLTLRNDEDQFNPNYALGPYYGKLLPNLKVLPYYGLEVTDASGNTSFEWITLGTFRTGDWQADSGDTFATVICNDFLFKFGDQDIPLIPTMENVTRYQVFETFFKANELASDNYEIDATLSSYTVPIAYFPKGKVKDGLSTMAEAFNCTVTMTRGNKIKVLSNTTVGSSVVTFSDTDMIHTSNMPQKFSNVYSEVNVRSNQHIVKSAQSILAAEDVNIPVAGRDLDKLSFTTSPSAFVEYIKISKATHLSIESISIGAQGMNLHLNNDASAQKYADLEIFGHPMDIAADEVEVVDTDIYDKIGSKKLPIDKYLIQEKSTALDHADKVKILVRDPSAYVYCRTRGDPSIELGDVITVVDNTNNLGSIEIIPLRLDYRYDGGLGCDILGIKKSAREAI